MEGKFFTDLWGGSTSDLDVRKLLHAASPVRWDTELNRFRDLAMSLADCKTVYALDGGLSAQLVFLGRKVNNVQKGSNRPVTDIIYFASAWFR